jgi:hypothetical protein
VGVATEKVDCCIPKTDFWLRRLSRRNLGPGGGNLFPQLAGDHLEPSQRIDVTKKIKEYDVEDWAKIVAVFKDWKFAPQVLTLSGFDPDRNEHSSRVTMGVSL